MATRKGICVLFGILAISAWVLGSATQAGAETMNYKVYTYMVKAERYPIGDMDEHTVGLVLRGAFYVFENGEVASGRWIVSSDFVKLSGPFNTYITMTFEDGSTIIIKVQGTVGVGYTSSGGIGEIIKGTGRFNGIKGSMTSKMKYLPVEKGEPGPKGYGEGTITYTPSAK